MQYKVFDVEDKTTSTGKALKKLTLQGEGKQYPDKNVTMWSDHPLFNEIAAGQKIDVELEITDSNKVNPTSGLPYKNKTVLNPGKAPRTPRQSAQNASGDAETARVMNSLNLKVLPALDRIIAKQNLIMKALSIKVDDEPIEYPKHTPTSFDTIPFDDEPSDDIKSAVPF